MKLSVEWRHPLTLKDGSSHNLIYAVDLDKAPDTAGVYVFGRRWGRSIEALYVGKATNIRRRVKRQLNNLRLMQHLKKATAGKPPSLPLDNRLSWMSPELSLLLQPL